MNRKLFLFSLGAMALILSGCASYTEAQRESVAQRRSGNVAGVAAAAKQNLDKHLQDRSAIVYALEAGSAYRDLALADLPPTPQPTQATPTGNSSEVDAAPTPLEISNRAFAVADDKIDEFDEAAKHSLSAGLATALVNPETAPYKGQSYDKIMVSTYRALNFIALGDPERARASFNKAYRRQADAVEENAKRIETEKEKIEAAKKGELKDEKGQVAKTDFDMEKAQNDQTAKDALDKINLDLDARMKAYEDYVNPFTVFSDALFMMTQATDAQEQERAAAQFKRVAAMADTNPFIKDDAVLAEQLATGSASLPKLTYVVFETGEAPHREEFKINLPIILHDGKVIVVAIPLAKLVFNDQFNENLSVEAAGKKVSTATISSMDAVIASDFKRALPSMYLDAFLSATTKAVLNYELQKKNSGGTAGLLLSLATNIYTIASSHPDTRTWQSLPKSFGYARFETPENNIITVSAGTRTKTVALPEGSKVNLVYVRQIQSGTDLLTSAVALK